MARQASSSNLATRSYGNCPNGKRIRRTKGAVPTRACSMRKMTISLLTLLGLVLCLDTASAQNPLFGGGGSGGGGGGGSAPVGGGGGGGAAPSPSFSGAPPGHVGGHPPPRGYHPAPQSSPGMGQGNPLAPRYGGGPGIVQRQYRTTPHYQPRPQSQYQAGNPLSPHAQPQQHTSRIYMQRRIGVLGAHHQRYRYRRQGYTHFYGGWWYASPWWLESYSDYDYWSSVCADRWGYGTRRYYSCMAYYGFY
jgi:hypothetical protein